MRALGAVQAQEWPEAQLAIQARAKGIAQADVVQTREVERAFVLTWALRGTLHLVAAADLNWLLALCGPGAIRATRRRYQQLGLSEPARERALTALPEILRREGALPRPQLAQALAAYDIPVAGQAIHHLLRFAALRGLICLGPERAGNLTYTLLEDWLAGWPQHKPPDPAGELARTYLAAYGPATQADFTRWSGLSAAQVKAGWAAIAADCATAQLPDGSPALLLKEQLPLLEARASAPNIRFLPRYDAYCLGYASRDFMIAAAQAKKLHPGGGLIRSCLSIDGEAMASWKLEKRRAGGRITIAPYTKLDAALAPLLEAEARQLGRFLNMPVELRFASG